MQKSIYINVPAVEDREFVNTIQDAFNKAKYPERIFIGSRILYANDEYIDYFEENIKESSQIKYIKEKVEIGKCFDRLGSGLGRMLSMQFYDNQDYILSIDSHSIFRKHWDEVIIDAFEKVKHLKEKVILTAYAPPYGIKNAVRTEMEETMSYTFYGKNFINDKTLGHQKEPIFNKYICFNSVQLKYFKDNINVDLTKDFYPANKFTYNFAFSDKNFLDDNSSSHMLIGEDLIKTIKLLHDDWTLVFPNIGTIVSHLYTPELYDLATNVIHKFCVRPFVDYFMLGDQLDKFKLLEFSELDEIFNNPEYFDTIKKFEQWAKIDLKNSLSPLITYVPETYW